MILKPNPVTPQLPSLRLIACSNDKVILNILCVGLLQPMLVQAPGFAVITPNPTRAIHSSIINPRSSI
jgi:hypothetical protein